MALRRFSRATAIATATFVLMLLALAGFASIDLSRERATTLAAADIRLGGTAAMLAAQIASSLEAVDIFVSGHVLTFEQQDAPLSEFARALLADRALQRDRLPQIVDIDVIDAVGVIRHSSDSAAVGAGTTDRDVFAASRATTGQGMLVGAPGAATPRSARLIPVSWPLRWADGRFVGVVVVKISGSYLSRFLDKAVTGECEFAALVDDTGRILLANQEKWPPELAAPRMIPTLAHAAPASDRTSTADRISWQLAERPVPGTTMRVAAGAPRDELLLAWRHHLEMVAVFAGVVLLILGAMTLALVRLTAQQRTDAELARRAQGAAEAAAQAKTEFLAAMSHEIRTPLTGVLGMADLLVAEPLGAKQKGYAQAIRTSGRHLLSVVNDILDFSRMEAGGLELERIAFSLAQMLEQVRSTMAPQATERGLTLRFVVDEAVPPIVCGDPTRIRQVLLNLVGNGLKFTHAGGVSVAIRAVPERAIDRPGLLRFEVRDTGIGIPAAKQAGLFEAFTQADRSTARRYGGSGLGLAICRRLVEAMDGRIGIDSAPDQGSMFWFEIPLEAARETALEPQGVLDQASGPPLRVLVAEDVELNRDLLSDMLGRHGHEVVFATNGEEAVALATKRTFDLVLMDVQMPVMDGVEATRRIRRLPPPAGHVPIVGLTANVLASERERYLAAGMNGCIGKPIVWPELFAALARHGGSTAGEAAPVTAKPAYRPAPPPADERDRLATLRRYAILDTPAEAAFDRIARLAAEIVGTPMALVSLIDEHRQWFKAKVGIERSETPRDVAFCAHAILSDELMMVPDAAKSPRFANHPSVVGVDGIRFYAGAPLTMPNGHRLGTLCTIDTRPRGLDERQRQALQDLAALTVEQLELRRLAHEAGLAMELPVGANGHAPDGGPRPASQAAKIEVPLLDRALIEEMGKRLPEQALAGFMRRGIENAERACRELGSLPVGSEEFLRQAHSLKGTSGSFGLKRIGEIARDIESAAQDGGTVAELVNRLAAVVAATRGELRSAGLLVD